MNDYAPLLFSYKPELFEKQLSFSQDYAAISKYGFSEQEYEHDNFPFYVNDDEHVLAHAAKICECLTSLDNDSGKELKLKKELIRDYKKYISCLSSACTGERELAAAFTEIMFAYNLDGVVVAEIKDYCQSDDDSDFCLSENQILNFDELYLKAGDRALFSILLYPFVLIFIQNRICIIIVACNCNPCIVRSNDRSNPSEERVYWNS